MSRVWPELLIGQANSYQKLGYCPFGMHQLITVLRGQISAAIFPRDATPYLYPHYSVPEEGGFWLEADPFMQGANDIWPLLKMAKRRDGNVKEGQGLFIPGGSYPSWLYLEDSHLLSHCFIDASNINLVHDNLMEQSLIDRSAASLLESIDNLMVDVQMDRKPPVWFTFATYVSWPRVKVAEESDRKKKDMREWQNEKKWGKMMVEISIPTPKAPSLVYAGSTYVMVSWTCSPSQFRGTVKGYTLTASPSISQSIQVAADGSSTGSIGVATTKQYKSHACDLSQGSQNMTLDGLLPDTEYDFTVSLTSDTSYFGTSDALTHVRTKKQGPPRAPSPPLIHGNGLSSLHFHFSPVEDDGGNAVTAVMFQKRVVPHRDLFHDKVVETGWTFAAEVPPTASEVIVRGLSPGTHYQIRVAAVNALGLGEWSEPSAPCYTSDIRRVDGDSADGESEADSEGSSDPYILVEGKGVAHTGSQLVQEHFATHTDAVTGPVVLLSDVNQEVRVLRDSLSVVGATVPVWSSHFSALTHDVKAEVAMAFPSHGCSSDPDPGMKDHIMLAVRGSCAMYSKAAHAAKSGALGLIVIDDEGNCDSGYTEKCVRGGDKSRGELWGSTDDPDIWKSIHIPVVLVDRKGGKMIDRQ